MAAAGIPPHVTWHMTLREIRCVLRGQRIAMALQKQMQLVLAYNFANLMRHDPRKRLPDIKPLLAQLSPFPPKKMSDRTLTNAIIGFAKATGAEVVYVPREELPRWPQSLVH